MPKENIFDMIERLNLGKKSMLEVVTEIDNLRAENELLRNAANNIIKKDWDIKLLSSDQCEALDLIEDALREVDGGKD